VPGASIVYETVASCRRNRLPAHSDAIALSKRNYFPTLNSWDEFSQPNSLWLTLLWIWSTDFIRRELPLVGVTVDRRGQRQ
jgi:hypothetical protein